MRRVTSLLLIALAALAAPGCGDDEPSAEGAVRDTVQRFLASAAAGDGREACELTDAAFRTTVGDDCPKGLTEIYAGEVPKVRDVRLRGDRATAKLTSPPPDEELELVREEGEWRVERMRLSWKVLDLFRDAAVEQGIPTTADFNRGDNEGVGYFEVNQRRGRRWSAAESWRR